MAAHYLNSTYTDLDVIKLNKDEIFFYININQQTRMSNCGPYMKVLGGFQNFGKDSIISFKVPISKNHYAVRVLFRFVKISSWDNETLFIYLEDQLVSSTTFGYDNDNMTGILCGLNISERHWFTAVRVFDFNINHTASDVALKLTTNLDGNFTDESWGMNDLLVNYYICDPSCDTCIGPSNMDCLRCMPTYTMIENKCSKCETPCMTCGKNSTTFCTSCSSKDAEKYLSSDLGTCTATCPKGKYGDPNNLCSDCPVMCSECLNFTYCLACNNSNPSIVYYKFFGTYQSFCIAESNCNSLDGYYLDKQSKIFHFLYFK